MSASTFSCPHCGNTTTYSILHQEESNYIETCDPTDPQGHLVPTQYFLISCASCSDISLFIKTWYDDGDIEDFFDAHLCYPADRPVHDLPARVMKAYEEARKVEKRSATAYVGQLRRALEAMCNEQGAQGKTLYLKIKDLAAKNIIPQRLCDLAHMLRELGNVGSHDTEYELDDNEVRILKDFFHTMVEYVYIGPAKLARLKASIDAKSKGKSQ